MKMKILKSLLCVAMAGTMLAVAACSGGGSDSTHSGGGESASQSEKGEIDMKKFPLYDKDYENLAYDEDDYKNAMSAPYWKGNVMYNELSLPILYENGEVYAKLYYAPTKVFTVKDQKLEKTYEEGKDYVVDKENKKLVIPKGSSIPALYEKADEGENPPEGFAYTTGMPNNIDLYTIWNLGTGNFVYTESAYFYGKYLSVSYAYDVEDLDTSVFAKYDATTLTAVRNKLKNGEEISLVTIGDSITEGCSSTGDNLHVAPNTPCYAKQIKTELERVYGAKVKLTNIGKGGSESKWPLSGEGSAALGKAKEAAPDLCIIAYGMNDSSSQVSPVAYDDNIRSIIREIKNVSENCEFILVNSFPCNPLYERDATLFDGYLKKLNKIAAEDEGGHIVVADMQKVGKYYMQTKKYCEISSSNVNHPNDFLHRVYAMNIVSTICDYKNIK